jgi:hypothetical protein
MFGRRQHSNDPTETLPDYGRRYLEHVISEYKTAKLMSPPPAAVEEVFKRYAAKPDSLTWADLCLIERALLELQPFPTIKRRAWGLRDKYREVAGSAEYNAYIASHPPNESDARTDPEEVRADLVRVLDALHWNYALFPIRERLRGAIINRIAGRILVAGLVMAGLASWCALYDEEMLATMLVVAFAGCLGGFMSLQQRIGSVPSDGDPLPSIFQLGVARTTLYLAPLSGAIFAVLLYFIFLGNLVDGGLFPKIEDPLYFKLGYLELGAGPYTGQNFAKLIVWSFIAGFAERFVPDILDRLVSRANTSQAPPASPAPPFSGQSPPAGAGGTPAVNSRYWSAPSSPPQ